MRTRIAASAAVVIVAALAATGPAVAGDKASWIGDTPRESGAIMAAWLVEHPRGAAKMCRQYALRPHATRETVVAAIRYQAGMGAKRAQRHWLYGYRPALNDYCRG